ncbi:5-methylcytosine restriction system specificity protein McrC [Sphingobacterium sp. IITKGP-BTPF85]|uniref:5-methylcytosine restriction system specificity protein McrC n=1 Tax=Sphingobacterium sp. IITKGP-BTPF85 TaxID=1338009 RepID=UPI00038A0381|nr:hypothetical protein [Sphingobacterium sp. IITKGP-BTPF85]KKX46605.1 hypothetical protein L950_0230995 [Sphingobacterium sp. IITKGP-BTPF85]
MKISLYEHVNHALVKQALDGDVNFTHLFDFDELVRSLLVRGYKDRRGNKYNCFHVSKHADRIELKADYYIGIDWLIKGHKYVHVQPKLNKYVVEQFKAKSDTEEDVLIDVDPEQHEELKKEENQVHINYIKMLLDAMSDPIVAKECADLVRIEWEDDTIKIEQQDDSLTPFLVVQFLQLLRQIVRKGLKKSYYKVRENLNNRIKGKILVSQQIKQNVLKNRFTKTYCEYQVFGEDNDENQFLKKVFRFVTAYISNHQRFFLGNQKILDELANYIRPSFEHIGDLEGEEVLRHFKYNPFFKEYNEAIKIGGYILKRFGYNVSRASENQSIETPPFWIDMPRLFELYVYQKLLQANNHDTNKIKYQYSTYGNAIDILIKDGENSIIIDAKYKLQYASSLVHQDIRQVAGYARLNKVRTELGMGDEDDRNIDCLIIYPNLNNTSIVPKEFKLSSISQNMEQIQGYYKVNKIGISMPIFNAKFLK